MKKHFSSKQKNCRVSPLFDPSGCRPTKKNQTPNTIHPKKMNQDRLDFCFRPLFSFPSQQTNKAKQSKAGQSKTYLAVKENF